MNTLSNSQQRACRGSLILPMFIIVLIVSVSVAALCAYVSQTSSITQRSTSMVAAQQFAQGGAVIAVRDLNTAVTNTSISNILTKLASLSYATYTLNTNLSTSSSNVYHRVISSSAPFSNQAVSVQIWFTNATVPPDALIVASANVGGVTQRAVVSVKMSFGLGAAILSVNDGTLVSGTRYADKSDAQDGNVSVSGNGNGPLVVNGGTNGGFAVLANGSVNVSSTNTSIVNLPTSAISQTNYTAGTPVPDYTAQGTSNTLFDINRLIAVANAMTNGFATNHNNHFTNLTAFVNAAKTHSSTNPLQGVIVADVVGTSDAGINSLSSASALPNGINVVGCLIFNFLGTGWDPTTSKIIVDVPLNVNPANLTGFNATNATTYPTGYPPAYTSTNYNPAYINIAPTYQNFSLSDDIPALIYTIGVVDIHNSVNISGVMYTPSYMEIENKHNGNTQYINGELIMGNGIFLENTSSATTVINYDSRTVNNLATSGTAGKKVYVQYWQ